MAVLPPPHELGAPTKFSAWYPDQEELVTAITDSPYRVKIVDAPTGTGKSIIAWMTHALQGGRTLFVTSTNGLLAQYVADFEKVGITPINGAGNYECLAVRPGGKLYSFRRPGWNGCDTAPCKFGFRCPMKEDGCLYYDQVRAANEASAVVTNYDYWLAIGKAQRQKGEEDERLGKFDRIIFDEAHNADTHVNSALRIELPIEVMTKATGRPTHPDADAPLEKWREWAAEGGKLIAREIDTLKMESHSLNESGSYSDLEVIEEIQKLEMLRLSVVAVARAKGDWVADIEGWGEKRNFVFEPVTPAPYCEEYLFRGVPDVGLFSATIREYAARYLGLTPDDYEFLEGGDGFPVDRRPVYFNPIVSMKWNMTAEDLRWMVAGVDNIIRERLDRKGIVHTVSYKRQQEFFTLSRYKQAMVIHSSSNTKAKVREFEQAAAPSVLVSPSVSTGWDFPYEQCEYIIIPKLPYPDTRSRIMKARGSKKHGGDPVYPAYYAARELVQMAGRGMRAPDDRCEIFILDSNWKWFRERYGKLLPRWFLKAVKQGKPNEPAPKLERRAA